MSEPCKRCGEVDDDRRTLWMACFYDMTELGLPLEQVAYKDALYAKKIGTRKESMLGMKVAIYETQGDSKRVERAFYTMRVCKNCRADWLEAIRAWFNAKPTDPDACGSDFYTRELGATRMAPPDDLMRDKEGKK